MTDDPDGNCSLAQSVFARAREAFKHTGHIPAQVAVPGGGPQAPVKHFSCVVLRPADEVTCTDEHQQDSAQFPLSAVGSR